jgi:hypothetical protein
VSADSAAAADTTARSTTPNGAEAGGEKVAAGGNGSAAGDGAAAGGRPSSDENPAPAKRGRKPGTARKTRTVALTLTVTGTAEGDWQADLVHGTNRIVRGMPIPAAAVARAAKELHPDIEAGIDTVLTEAREQHRSRMQELEAELEKVKRALADLGE